MENEVKTEETQDNTAAEVTNEDQEAKEETKTEEPDERGN